MVNLLKYIEEKNGTFESPRYSRGLVIAELVIAEFHCSNKLKLNKTDILFSHNKMPDFSRPSTLTINNINISSKVINLGRSFR